MQYIIGDVELLDIWIMPFVLVGLTRSSGGGRILADLIAVKASKQSAFLDLHKIKINNS
jgi:hypothetical protein